MLMNDSIPLFCPQPHRRLSHKKREPIIALLNKENLEEIPVADVRQESLSCEKTRMCYNVA